MVWDFKVRTKKKTEGPMILPKQNRVQVDVFPIARVHI